MFPCIKCGLCCKHIDNAVKSVDGMFGEFPYKWDETGKCEMLGEDHKCKVYDNRPLLCNIDRVRKEFELPEKDFYNENIAECNRLLKQHGNIERIELFK